MAGTLSAAEREIIITSADDDKDVFHVFSDSRRWRRKLLKLAQRLNAEVRPTGAGFEFDVPFAALSFRVPRKRGKATEAQMASMTRARQAARNDSTVQQAV